jgi:integrase/recombinase XerD
MEIENPLSWDEMTVFEDEAAVAYTSEELKTLFAAMTEEEKLRYRFFLKTGAREREVTYASWSDLDLVKGNFHVRSKSDVGFFPKSHQSRTVPIPKTLIEMLRERKKSPPHPRWVFANRQGLPEKHFLRKLRYIALRAGLNCGQCRTTITKGRYEGKGEVEVSCKTDPVCEHWYLHRLRKTCVSAWEEMGIPIRTIQAYLGHKSLEVTMIYLGVSTSPKIRGAIDVPDIY